jgi:Flp pilus assembly protein CpaB
MKTIGRIAIILLAAAVVAGAAWALTRNTSSGQAIPAEAQFRPGDDFGGEGFAPGRGPEGLREGGFERGRGGFRQFGWIKNIVLIAMIVAVVLLFERFLDRRQANRAVAIPYDEKQTG